MIVKNQIFDLNNICEDSIFVCAVGYEERSFYLFDKINGKICDSNKLVIFYDDYELPKKSRAKLEEIKNNSNIARCMYEYHDVKNAIEHILTFINEKVVSQKTIVHVDYTSMPRSWFCRLALELQKIQNCKSFFWYTEGEYPNYTQYPGAGIDQFMLFSGKPTLRINKRFHVFGLGYDSLRTQALISLLDPDAYITCYASNANNTTIKNELEENNNQIISQSRISVALHLEDFESMINKLREVILDYVKIGDVVLIPDGPKPLIMAMSLMPSIVNDPGVSCLHVSRNKKHFKPVDVKALNDSVIGFSLS